MEEGEVRVSIQDPRLAAAMAEVQGVLDKWDVMAVIVLADGQGHAEYRMAVDRPSWSTIRFVKGGNGLHLKGYMKTMPVETQRTTNAVVNLSEASVRMAMMLTSIDKTITNALGTEKEEGTWEDRGPEVA